MSRASSDNEIIYSNLSETAERRRRLSRLVFFEGCEILSRIKPRLHAGGNAAGALAAVSAEFRRSSCLDFFGTSELVDICRRLCGMMRDAGVEPSALLAGSAANEERHIIGYVPNRFTEDALGVFLRSKSGWEGVVYGSFSEMCEQTGAGGCGACVLPVENTTDGKLPGFYSLIERFDLKISLMCDIVREEDNHRTRYALLGGALVAPAGGEELYFEFSLTNQGKTPPHEILHAAGHCGLEIYRVDSLPLRYSEGGFIINPVLRGKFDDIIVFAAYLGFMRIQYTPVGLSRLLTEP